MAANVGLSGDAFFNQLIGGALGASWGGLPPDNTLMAGPTSHLSQRLKVRMAPSTAPWLANIFPTPSFSSELSSQVGGLPPFLQPAGFNFFGGGANTGANAFNGIPGAAFNFFG